MGGGATKPAHPEWTFAIIKPDAVAAGKGEEILAKIKEHGFEVIKQEQVHLSKEKAQGFYKEHEGKPFYEGLVDFMSSGPAIVLVLQKEDAIKGWRELLGPTNSEKAKAEAPNSIRALYGTDGRQNAGHGSDSPASASREIAFFFPDLDDQTQFTFAMIKPDAVKAGKAEEIISKAKADGFTVVKQQELQLTKEKAEEFASVHRGKTFFDDLVNFLISGPIVALVLQKEKEAVTSWRKLLGPTDTDTAKAEAPNSIRGLFGTDKTQNAAHGADSAESANTEIHLFFPELATPPKERTYAMIKPDAVGAGHVDAIIEKIKANNFEVIKQHQFTFTREKAEEFYHEHLGKPFFEGLIAFMTSGPVIGLILEKEDAIKGWRALAGPTNSETAKAEAPDSIRALYGTDGQKNAVHGSDAPETAAREIRLIFA